MDKADFQQLKKVIQDSLYQKLDFSREILEEELVEMIDEELLSRSKTCFISLNTRKKLRNSIFYSLRELDILQNIIEDSEITEIMVNGPQNIFLEKAGKLIVSEEEFESQEKLYDVIGKIVSKCNRTVNEASPIVDARLEDGSRVNIVLPPVSLIGPVITIRRFPKEPFTMKKLIEVGALSQKVSDFLKMLVEARYNIFISGGTGSGKTTFLNALSNFIPYEERLITIEDSAELQIQSVKNLVRLETRNATSDGCEEISIRDLIKASLRMRPDRIIVGEVRGKEAIDMMQCYNTGHDGSMSTGHANSAKDMLSRLETMILMGMDIPLQAIKQQIASGIDIIVHLGRLRDKSRKVLEISEIIGYENSEIILNTIYKFEEDGINNDGKVKGTLLKKGELLHCEKLKAAGIQLERETMS